MYRDEVIENEADDIADVLAGTTANELRFVLDRLAAGEIDGSVYINVHDYDKDQCGCLLGTIGMARLGLRPNQRPLSDEECDNIADVGETMRDRIGMRPAEEAFGVLSPGSSPQNDNYAAAIDAFMREVALSNPTYFGAREKYLPPK